MSEHRVGSESGRSSEAAGSKRDSRTIRVGEVSIGADSPPAIVAGPCSAESLDLCLSIGEAMRDRCSELGLGYVFKASFDKANRSSIHSRRGLGLDEGLAVLEKTGRSLGVPVTTDIHEPGQAAPVAQAVDLLQIPAFLCRQTDLLSAAAATGRPVNVKKGQFLSPAEMAHVVRKLEQGFASVNQPPAIMLTERGTFFGYHQLVNDFGGIVDLLGHGWPVCFDATHSTQKPGKTDTTGGRPELASTLARCAVTAGVHAVFLETHPEPERALSDAATMLPLPAAIDLLADLAALDRARRTFTAELHVEPTTPNASPNA